jgi:hypothetical protein
VASIEAAAMNEHERLMAAARASLLAARELGLPADAPELGVQRDGAEALRRIEAAYARERQANRELRVAVIDYGRKTGWVLRAVTVLALLAIAGGAVGYSQLREIAARNAATAKRATEAVRVSCTLLTNAIIESGGGGRDQAPASEAARAQRQITAILVGAINRGLLTDAERAEVKRLGEIVARAGGVISIPDCNEIARHPERVRELLLSETRSPARRSPAAP